MQTVRKLYASEAKMVGSDEAVRAGLEHIGLSQNEISLYRSVLSLGPRPASTLAKSLGMQRTRVYDLLSSLESRGLVEMVERNRVRYFIATSPDRLLSLIHEHKNRMHMQFAALEKAVPQLFDGSGACTAGVEARAVRGARLVREMLEEIIDDGNPLLSIGDIESTLLTTVGLSRWAKDFREMRLGKKRSLLICLQGPPDLLEEKSLLRETLSSPDIPHGSLQLIGHSIIVLLNFSDALQATRVHSQTLCSVAHGLYSSWLDAVKRIS